MSKLTAVELQGMTTAQGTFQTALDDTTRSYAQVEGQIEALQASWTGEAATIFNQAMTQWLEDFRSVNNALSTMLEKLAQNTNVYANTHADTEQVAQQVAQTIGSGNYGGLPGL
ncbi:WXG100 family type VII secretion target [Streptacidiphilus jiangxiensis]|uniref:WXG100 family type VII secretion target n=1 Tax=Streptacidiphilus jiangxiensis TaxID=235985 RepID=A0A1H7P7I6_STRJI|nr:WXG100 family type VII secretion target [Streptacidiphilus jiangxiensis]SEL31047.1 WXG100 family type VII secretion target [Streptacidiphilus jiangxiensis]